MTSLFRGTSGVSRRYRSHVGEDFSPALQELLNQELGTNPTTVRGLTNHLPMALVAKEALGADDDELIRFATAYASRITWLVEPSNRLTTKTWQTAIGNHAAAAELRSYFLRQVAESGSDETLRTHLPILIPGIGGGAFHGIIRLAYALEVSSSSRIAAGMAYLAEVGSPLRPLLPTHVRTQDPFEILAGLSVADDRPVRPTLKTIDEEMRVVAQNDVFDAAVASLEITDDTSQKLANAALHVFASSDDFTALHGVTGLEAIASIRPYIDDGAHVTRLTFQALVAAYLSIGAPPLWSRDRLDEFIVTYECDPESVRSKAAYSDDEHVSKLVYTARRSWERCNDPLYLAVAARKALPIP